MFDITNVRVNIHEEGKVRGFADITLDDCLVIHGLVIISGSSGFFVAFPSRKNKKTGEHVDVVHPINRDCRRLVEDSVLSAYEREVENGQPQGS